MLRPLNLRLHLHRRASGEFKHMRIRRAVCGPLNTRRLSHCLPPPPPPPSPLFRCGASSGPRSSSRWSGASARSLSWRAWGWRTSPPRWGCTPRPPTRTRGEKKGGRGITPKRTEFVESILEIRGAVHPLPPRRGCTPRPPTRTRGKGGGGKKGIILWLCAGGIPSGLAHLRQCNRL